MSIEPRPMLEQEIEAVAMLWHDTWHGTHDPLAPTSLCDFRTKDYFRRRVDTERATVRVCGWPGRPVGMCMAHDATLDMLFVAAAERGKGIGERLLADAEARMRDSGVDEACLYVNRKNGGAIRFYLRNGWRDAGTEDKVFEAVGGLLIDTVAKMTKKLRP